MKYLGIGSFLSLSDVPLIDVRSPGEYAAGHIPGATSVPLFSNAERAIVGTAYKQKSQHEAILEGLRIAGRNMPHYLEAVESLHSPELRIHCWRGGMRSESMAWLFDKLVSQTYVLEGGYKVYRHSLLEFFSKPLPLHILTGYTGSGKTRILHALKKEGQQVIDLEGLANHQGSSFGNQKSSGQPPTEHFQNLLYEEFRRFDLSRPIWLEDESFCIGGACMPEALFEQMHNSPRFLLHVEKDMRLENILKDYGTMEAGKLIQATRGISKKLGVRQTEEAELFITEGRLKEAAAILLAYYDKRYAKSLDKTRQKVVATLDIKQENHSQIAKALIQLAYVR